MSDVIAGAEPPVDSLRSLRVDGDRLWSTLDEMALIGPGRSGGCNRQALTPEDGAGRDLFVRWARDAGCQVAVDEVGNIFATYAGADGDAAPVATGSHLDTQATGGKFDGVYGVLAGLEVVRTLREADIRLKRAIEITVWTNEEGCRFAPAMLGSGVVSGVYSVEFAYTRADKDGKLFGDELTRIGYRGDKPAVAKPYAALLEAHIEQGPVLEHERRTIGVVTGIQGAYWFDVTLTGQSCHAGPTPMSMRRDPWRGAIEAIAAAFAIADAEGPDGRCTIGDMRALPGARNTVPEQLTFPIDIRHPDGERLDSMVASLKDRLAEIAAAHRLELGVEQVWHMAPTRFDARLCDAIEASAEGLGLSRHRMVSGAGHDSLHTAQFAPTAMIFVPCAGGLSHNEAEDASKDDLTAGANVLLQSILALASE